MEDRCGPGLYLEMTERPLDTYARDRVPDVLALPGVTRATWWRNVHRDREDLPRVLPEFDHLGVYEVDDEFTAPSTPADVAGHHFRRTPRPGQGSLSGRPTVGLSLVLVSPKEPEGAQALRDWADFVHIRHIAEASVPGFTMITPYERVDGESPRYLHLYELDVEDPEAAFKAMTPSVAERLGGSFGTPAFDAWATDPSLQIDYVNTFRLAGSASPPQV